MPFNEYGEWIDEEQDPSLQQDWGQIDDSWWSNPVDVPEGPPEPQWSDLPSVPEPPPSDASVGPSIDEILTDMQAPAQEQTPQEVPQDSLIVQPHITGTPHSDMPQDPNAVLTSANDDTNMPAPPPELPPMPPAELPDTTVGNDALSTGIDEAIRQLMQGGTGDATSASLDAALQDLLAQRGQPPAQTDADRVRRFEAISDPIQRGSRALLENLRGDLANRGQIGSGLADDAVLRAYESRIAPQFADQLRQAGIDLDRELGQEATQRLTSALSTGANRTGQRLAATTSGVSAGNERQRLLGELALGQLDQNRQWNEFLAEFGLKREEVQHAMESGQLDQLLQLFAAYQGLLGRSQEGFL